MLCRGSERSEYGAAVRGDLVICCATAEPLYSPQTFTRAGSRRARAVFRRLNFCSRGAPKKFQFIVRRFMFETTRQTVAWGVIGPFVCGNVIYGNAASQTRAQSQKACQSSDRGRVGLDLYSYHGYF
ncbi:hypothetical protein WJX74_003496 [Apatococcus lobatus]|uniref:Uncharacterized protein n=1 Tax=Apatococcus lobatus TaxID=904363 RepID=A0AAW1RY98_9CHLO